MDKHYLDINRVSGFASVKKLKQASKATYNQTRKYLQSVEAYNRTKRVIRKFKRRKIIARHSGELLQADLFDNSKLSKFNRGYKWVLLVTDTLSKRLYLVPLKSKSGVDVARGLKSVIEKEPRTRLLLTDLGKEFYNKHVTQEVLIPNNIKLYSTYSNQKAAQSERLGRFLRERLERYYIHSGSKNWIDIIGSIETVYNNTKHSRTLIEPNNVNEFNEMDLVARLFPPLKPSPAKFEIGQLVRILKSVNIFAKLTKAQFTPEIFEIYKINYGNPTTYNIRDLQGEPVLGNIYFEELSPVSRNQPITKVAILRRKNRRHRRYIQFKTLGNKTPVWEAAISFNKKVRDGHYEII
jgi:hypothetical protein